MRESFAASLGHVLVHEGGWSDHPDDPGGATNKGITLATYRNWLGRPVSKDELRAISDNTVTSIYRSRYWNAVKADDLPAGLDHAVFDYGVNSGPVRAVKALQTLAGAASDGRVGPQTLAAVAQLPAAELIVRLCAQRLGFLKGLSTWPVFGRGWERRVRAVEQEALALAGASPGKATGPVASAGAGEATRPGGSSSASVQLPRNPAVEASAPTAPQPPSAQPRSLFAVIVDFILRLLGFGR